MSGQLSKAALLLAGLVSLAIINVSAPGVRGQLPRIRKAFTDARWQLKDT